MSFRLMLQSIDLYHFGESVRFSSIRPDPWQEYYDVETYDTLYHTDMESVSVYYRPPTPEKRVIKKTAIFSNHKYFKDKLVVKLLSVERFDEALKLIKEVKYGDKHVRGPRQQAIGDEFMNYCTCLMEQGNSFYLYNVTRDTILGVFLASLHVGSPDTFHKYTDHHIVRHLRRAGIEPERLPELMNHVGNLEPSNYYLAHYLCFDRTVVESKKKDLTLGFMRAMNEWAICLKFECIVSPHWEHLDWRKCVKLGFKLVRTKNKIEYINGDEEFQEVSYENSTNPGFYVKFFKKDAPAVWQYYDPLY